TGQEASILYVLRAAGAGAGKIMPAASKAGRAPFPLSARGPTFGSAIMHHVQSFVWGALRFFVSGTSHPEDLRVTCLDLLARSLDPSGIVSPEFDVVEPTRPRLLFSERVDRMLAGKVDQQLLRLERMQPILEQARGIRMGRRIEYRARAGD